MDDYVIKKKKVKMQNLLFKFHQNSFQLFDFAFVYYSRLNLKHLNIQSFILANIQKGVLF